MLSLAIARRLAISDPGTISMCSRVPPHLAAARQTTPKSHASASRTLTNARCRELLGSCAEELSDDDVDAVRRHAETMADLLIDMFLRDRATKR
jgi:hypothetical protein